MFLYNDPRRSGFNMGEEGRGGEETGGNLGYLGLAGIAMLLTNFSVKDFYTVGGECSVEVIQSVL